MKISKLATLFLAIGLSMFSERVLATQQDIDHWLTETGQHPDNGLGYFNLGRAYDDLHRNNEALMAFERTVELKSPLAPAALYYEAVIFEKMGSTMKAKKTLAKISIEQLPPNLKTQVLEFKNSLYANEMLTDSGLTLDQKDSELSPASEKSNAGQTTIPTNGKNRSRVNLLMDLSEGWNSNPGVLPSGQTVSVPGDRQTQVRAGADALLNSSWMHELKLNYFYSGTFFSSHEEFDFDENDFTLPVFFYFGHFRVKLVPIYIVQGYALAPFSMQSGGNAELAYREASTFWGLGYQGMSIDSVNTAFSYLTGAFAKYYAYSERHWSNSKLLLELSLSTFASADNSVVGASNTAGDLLMTYNEYWGDYDMAVSVVAENRVYVRGAQDTMARNDWKETGDLQFGYALSPDLRLYLDGGVTGNQSNMNSGSANYSYTQGTLVIGLSSHFGI